MPNWHCTDLYGKDLHEEEGLPQGISFFYLQQKTPRATPKKNGMHKGVTPPKKHGCRYEYQCRWH